MASAKFSKGSVKPATKPDNTVLVSPLTPIWHPAPPPVVDARSPVDQLLASCPTDAEILDIYRVFPGFSVEGGAPTQYACTDGGTESSPMLNAINMFRLARLVHFDAPIPLLNATNVWEWLASLSLRTILFTHDAEFSNGGNRDVQITMRGGFDEAWRRSTSPGQFSFAAPSILVHEGWHAATNKMHPCNHGGQCCTPQQLDTRCPYANIGTDDPSLEYGGAWAAHFWYLRWLARHSGDYLSADERNTAEAMSRQILDRMARRPSESEIAAIEEPYLRPATSGTMYSQGTPMNFIPPHAGLAFARPSGYPLGQTVATPPQNEHAPASPAVRYYQRILLGKGFSVGTKGADGILGPETSRGIEAFKRWYNDYPADSGRGDAPMLPVDRSLSPAAQLVLQRFESTASDVLGTRTTTTIVRPSAPVPAQTPWLAIAGGTMALVTLVAFVSYANSHSKRRAAQA